MVMVGMMVMGVLSVGLRSFRVTSHVSHDQAQHIGHFSRIPATSAIANTLDCHQWERPEMTDECRNDGGACKGGHFFLDNTSIRRETL